MDGISKPYKPIVLVSVKAIKPWIFPWYAIAVNRLPKLGGKLPKTGCRLLGIGGKPLWNGAERCESAFRQHGNVVRRLPRAKASNNAME